MADNLQDPHGRGNARFATTHWSLVCRAATGSDDSRHALGKLIESYWYPLYAFARRRGHSDHDAMDLTQGYLAHLLEGNALDSVSPDKGRFRSFLLASFTNFMANQRRAAGTIRRGGAVVMLSLTTVDFQARYDREPADPETPELLFQRSWVESLLLNVRTRLAEDYRIAGKADLFVLLEPHLTHRGDALPRAEISQRLNLSAAAVAMSLHRMRRRYGELLREEIAATVNNPEDVEDELRSLMEIVGTQ
jgi:RNA polymerase sigma factor (sigma-70 family)